MRDTSLDKTAPQSYAAHWEPFILGGGGRWTVRMNNWLDKEQCADRAEAERLAAKRNYEEGCYGVYGKFGLDGI